MSDLHRNDSRAVVYAGMSTAIAVILSMIGLYMPVLSMVAFLLIPLPIARLAMMQGLRWAVIVTAGVIILDSVFFGIVSAASVGAMFGVLGVVLGGCYQYRLPAVKTLLFGGAAVFLSMIIQGLLMAWAMGFEFTQLTHSTMAAMETVSNDVLPQYYSGDMLDKARAEMKSMMDFMVKALPFSLVMGALFYSWAAMFLSKKVFTRLGVKDMPSLPSFERWEMPKATVYIYVIGVILRYMGDPASAVSAYMGSAAPYLSDGGLNLTLLGMFLFWLQGAAVVWWAPHRWPLIRPVRWIIIVFGLLTPAFQMMLFLVGLFDLILGYRRKRNYQ